MSMNLRPTVIYKIDKRCTCSDNCGCERVCGMQVQGAKLKTKIPGFLHGLIDYMFPKLVKGVIVFGTFDDDYIEATLTGRMGSIDDGISYYVATLVIGAATVTVTE
jgi:hypothetical protein